MGMLINLTSIITTWMITIAFSFGYFVTFFGIIERWVASVVITWWWCWWFWWSIRQVTCRACSTPETIVNCVIKAKCRMTYNLWVCFAEIVIVTYQHCDGQLMYAIHNGHMVHHSYHHIANHIDLLRHN